jgi:hypothetical protein
MRRSIAQDRPLGGERWMNQTVRRLGWREPLKRARPRKLNQFSPVFFSPNRQRSPSPATTLLRHRRQRLRALRKDVLLGVKGSGVIKGSLPFLTAVIMGSDRLCLNPSMFGARSVAPASVTA